ncbi:hypothetical protein G3I44_13520 [Halogeometricum borinquense]|uniref:Uncharacterized protein n=1 Tax=Halogeometricum borinquense TaxID=60847 RepID=A0A6C0UI77_9EURY|nr:hypothetical protein [Halogeometricum borinquense]QIB75212.1 hypothetical protein G3I44_13520 [Halogeometricum borinquense]
MERREFTKAVVSVPVVSIPSLPSGGVGKNNSESKEEYWEISSAWFREYDHGDLMIIRNGEVKYRWKEIGSFSEWHKATLLNARFVADQGHQPTEYVADLFDLTLKSIYIDPPYFSVEFESDQSEVHIHQGKYSDSEYAYHVETHTDEALEGYEGEADSIEEAVQDIHEFISQRRAE